MDTFKNTPEWKLENLKGAILLASQTIKSLEIINGGGAIAVLSFYGHALTSTSSTAAFNKCALIVALVAFALGVGSAVFCSIAAYISQRLVAVGTTGEMTAFYFSLSFGLLSAILFVVGVVASAFSFK